MKTSTLRSQRSIEFLEPRCRAFLRKQGAKHVVLIHENADVVWPRAETVDVVVMGNALTLLFNRAAWPPEIKVRLWVLSETNRKLLTEVGRLSPRQVGLIPRYELAPKRKRKLNPASKLNQRDEPLHLIFSGRNAPRKNLDLFLEVANYIQHQIAQPVKVTVLGPYLKAVETKTLRWKSKPTFGDGGINWTDSIKGSPVLFALSTSYEEDFGVSIAQAEAKGWPLVLSRWGAHLDVQASQTILVDSKLIDSPNRKRTIPNISGQFFSGADTARHKKANSRRPLAVRYSQIALVSDTLSEQARKRLNEFCTDQLVRVGSSPLLKRIREIMAGN